MQLWVCVLGAHSDRQQLGEGCCQRGRGGGSARDREEWVLWTHTRPDAGALISIRMHVNAIVSNGSALSSHKFKLRARCIVCSSLFFGGCPTDVAIVVAAVAAAFAVVVAVRCGAFCSCYSTKLITMFK